jgi:hypothetical protein
MSVYHPPVEEHENVVKAALRVIGSTHYQRADDPHADAEQEYAEEQLALAARALTQAVDRKDPDEQPIGWASNDQGSELHHLRQESLLLRSLAQEFRVPLSNAVGGYGEVVVRRWTLAQDRWQVTDGSVTDPKVWIDGQWLSIASVGLEKAHPYTLDEALKTAHQVAEYEGAAFEAWVKGTTSVVRGGGE